MDQKTVFSKGLPWLGPIVRFARNPYAFMQAAHDACGEVASFTLLGQRVHLLTGAEASALFYKSSDEMLDQSAAYQLMTPIFGPGLVFDAPTAKKNEQLKMLMPVLRLEAMRGHASKVVQEVEDLTQSWQKAAGGEVELVAFMKQLTINTASHCLLGREFRYELTDEFAQIYHDLEKGIQPIAYHFPNLPLPAFKQRDRARARLQELVGGIVAKRGQQADKPDDMLQSLIDASYADGSKLDANEITGLLIAAIFAGHHTSSGTAAWVLIELLRHPHLWRQARAEVDAVLGADGAITFDSLRELPTLEAVLKEVLRLHPPLILLMRQVLVDIPFKDHVFKAGDMVWASPPVTQRMASLFPNPLVFDIERYAAGREEDRNLMAYQPFGGGKHKCSGNSFAIFQIKAIFALLLQRFDFELIDAPADYHDDYTQMIVQPAAPCRVRYRPRQSPAAAAQPALRQTGGCPMQRGERAANTIKTEAAQVDFSAQKAEKTTKTLIIHDAQLCQGHAMCQGEAPDYFFVDAASVLHLKQNEVQAGDEEKVHRAVHYCPNGALRLEAVQAESAGLA
ncbi:MAG: cytochrome P450 [Cellvibrionales bacterium]|nr:MAG: cytochrome P450 [Cellvibrionales bacterium]